MSESKLVLAYQKGNSFFHSIDPVSKLVWVTGLFIISITVTQAIPQMIMLVYVFLVALFLAKIPPQKFGWLVGLMAILSISFFIFQCVVIGGPTVVFRLGPFPIALEAIDIGGAVAFRGLVFVAAAAVFVKTTEPRDLMLVLSQKFKMNYVFGVMVLMALRFIPLFEKEYDDLRDARIIRGVRRERRFSNPMKMVKDYIIPLAARGFRRAETTAFALDSKGFRAYPTRTSTRDVIIRPIGVGFAIVSLAFYVGFFIYIFSTGGIGLIGFATPLR